MIRFPVQARRPFAMAFILSLVSVAFMAPPAAGAAASPTAQGAPFEVRKTDAGTSLSAGGLGIFYRTVNDVDNARVVEVPDSRVKLLLWEERQPDGGVAPYYAISLDGRSVSRVRRNSRQILLRSGPFDPLESAGSAPAVPAEVAAGSGGGDEESLYIVQFVTQPLEEFRRGIRALGGTILKYVANDAYIVKLKPAARDAIADLPFVRWVGPYHPAYRLEPPLLERFGGPGAALPPDRYNIQLFERGEAVQKRVARSIVDLGGATEVTDPQGILLTATLDGSALLRVARMNEVEFIDRWSAPELDVTTAREIGGANYIESVAGFAGEGVRGEVMDAGVRDTHVDFQSRPLLMHGPNGVAAHGTSTTGIVFGDGTGDPRGRGLLPLGQGIAANMSQASRRFDHTAELLADPYFAVFQSNSWGGALTTAYTTVSAAMDDILFHNDILITQSQSNSGSQLSRPEAWAKNIVSVGGIRHFGSLDMSDHHWNHAGSIGPAADGRIKPDLAHFYDMNFTATSTSDTAYTSTFGGTSAATPITAGHFGLFFEMWHHGIFGNPTGATVFHSRPHMATSKAVLINTARQWTFSGLDDDLTRTHQGWGLVDVGGLYDLRDNILIIDQTDVLQNLESTAYSVTTDGDMPLRATLVFTDPPGNPASTVNRVNDLTLKVTSPSGVVYWGNNGLLSEMWSAPGGEADTIDTVENVFIESPEPGAWTIEVIASEINEDEHLDTPEVDADYALVVSGIVRDGS
jgi:hypothetical protein